MPSKLKEQLARAKEVKRSPMFSDLKPGVTAWLGKSPTDRRIQAEFQDEPVGNSIHFHVINGAWDGTLNCDDEDEGSLQIVDERGEVHENVYIVDIEESLSFPDDDDEDDIPY